MESRKNWRIKKSIIFLVLALVLVFFIGFVEKKGAERKFSGLEVYVDGVSNVYFVDEKEVTRLLENGFPELKPGNSMKDISLHLLEKKVERHPFVKNAEAFSDLKGKVIVKVTQHVPIARISRPLAADGYLSSEGLILPTSPNYTSRVLIIEGRKAEELLQKENISQEHGELLELIRYIREDNFWNAQINSLELLPNGEINLYQQVGSQVIEFGKPLEIEEKFKKITLYYTEIISQKGWNAYKRINVKFKDQIICE